MIDKQYKVGVIGAGKIVENQHLPVLKNLKNVKVEWIYDTNNARSKLMNLMYGVQALLDNDWENAVKNIDICLITIPYGVRTPYITAAAKFNKSVYVEKPFALSVREHLETISLFKSHEITVGFQRRFYKITSQLKHIVTSNIFGNLKSIDLKQGYFTLKGGDGYISDVRLAGGGIILESAIHSFDLILNFTDATDVEVHNIKYIQKNGIDYDSTGESILITPYGKLPVTCQISTLRNLSNGLTVSFEKAILKCDLSPEGDIHVLPLSGHSQYTLQKVLNDNDGSATTVGMSFYIFWKKYLDALNHGKSNITSAENSLLTTKWMENIYNTIKG